MRQTVVFLILAFSFIQNSNAQHEYKYEYLDSLTKSFVSQLKSEQVDTILVYREDCVSGNGYIELVYKDSCEILGYPPKVYCFWKNENKTYLRRVESETCYNYNTIELDIDVIWNFVFANKEKLTSERIKPKMYVENSDTNEVWIDHYCFQEFFIIDRQNTLAFELSNFFFEETVLDKFENLSYKDNWSTKRKKLQLLLHEIVGTIDDKLLREKKYK